MGKVYQELARLVVAVRNCRESGNTLWEDKHKARGDRIARDYLPHGSGFDNGTTLDWERSTGERLKLATSFHHMNDVGYYCGWTDHVVTVRASLGFSFELDVSGRNRNGIKEYISEAFHHSLGESVAEEGQRADVENAARALRDLAHTVGHAWPVGASQLAELLRGVEAFDRAYGPPRELAPAAPVARAAPAAAGGIESAEHGALCHCGAEDCPNGPTTDDDDGREG